MRTYKILNKFNDIYIYVTTWVYNNQECVDIKNYSWECEKSKGQPPPSGEGKGLSDQRKAIISDHQADWHKNHSYGTTGAESQENQILIKAITIIVNYGNWETCHRLDGGISFHISM